MRPARARPSGVSAKSPLVAVMHVTGWPSQRAIAIKPPTRYDSSSGWAQTVTIRPRPATCSIGSGVVRMSTPWRAGLTPGSRRLTPHVSARQRPVSGLPDDRRATHIHRSRSSNDTHRRITSVPMPPTPTRALPDAATLAEFRARAAVADEANTLLPRGPRGAARASATWRRPCPTSSAAGASTWRPSPRCSGTLATLRPGDRAGDDDAPLLDRHRRRARAVRRHVVPLDVRRSRRRPHHRRRPRRGRQRRTGGDVDHDRRTRRRWLPLHRPQDVRLERSRCGRSSACTASTCRTPRRR